MGRAWRHNRRSRRPTLTVRLHFSRPNGSAASTAVSISISLRLREVRIPQDATIHHFIPLSRGGARGWSNRVLSCRPCNGRKGNRLPTPEEAERWNALGMSWPHLACLDLSFAYKKRCYQCNEWINPFRLKASIDSRAETRTCSERCRRKLKPTEHHNREQLDAKAPCWVRLTDTGLPSHHCRTGRTTTGPGRCEEHVEIHFGTTPAAQGFSRCSGQFLGTPMTCHSSDK
jgi:5-methylcytosine-specific restriction endonuclease McrA